MEGLQHSLLKDLHRMDAVITMRCLIPGLNILHDAPNVGLQREVSHAYSESTSRRESVLPISGRLMPRIKANTG